MAKAKAFFLSFLFSFLALSFLLATLFGSVYIPLGELFAPQGVYKEILLDIRLPTVVSAALIGASIAVSGAVLQLLLRNPIVDPYITGTASGGAFGAVLAYFLLAFGLPFSWVIYFSPLVAFVFALFSTLVTIAIGRRGGVYGIVVGGVVVSYLFSSLITIMLVLIELRFPQVPPLTFWLLGDVQVVGWEFVVTLALLVSILLSVGIAQARKIDLVSISDEMSYARGVNPSRFRVFWVVMISLVTAFIVSQVGIVGFVGIVVPHIIRKFAGGSATTLVPFSALLGASTLLLSNVVADGALGVKIPITPITAILAFPVIVCALVRGVANQGA
ncbi:MAG: transport system permease [Candidatus Aramenus sulfurataquae]|jgi:iron complex transport system permease protein|uniref:Iron ABC transporter permease n=2 Tax=Candidatus Aramenus sulfurataquae TaxID=1326980 RepID=W7KP97_9CREN|nr:MAG: transport system permease [Candidatus Aramenus sulfurataquae]MCL7344535.1 iron ABC transporter permease [Candidatus Aramenus sulfurataquae]